MDIAEIRIEIMEAFADLLQTLSIFETTYRADPSPVGYVSDILYPGLPLMPDTKERALYIINQLQYLGDQDPREILVCPGIVPIAPPTITAIKNVNDAKLRFKNAILAAKALKTPMQHFDLNPFFDETLNKRDSKLVTHLRRTGLARLHLKQCYRVIPLLEMPPAKISWTWANTRSIKRITTQEAEIRLRKKGTDVGIQFQLQKLASISEHECLAIVQDLAPHLRANLVFQDDNMPAGEIRKMLKGPLPIFYPYDLNKPFPVFKPIPDKYKSHNRQKRADQKLDPEPFLQAIRAHRYLG